MAASVAAVMSANPIAFVATMGNFAVVGMFTTADSLTFVETDDRGLTLTSWNSFACA